MAALVSSCDHAWQLTKGPTQTSFCGTKEKLQPNVQMGEVLKLNGEKLSLKESLKEAVRALEEDGCLVLKGATNLTAFPDGVTPIDSVRADIALNESVGAILFSARDDDLRISGYKAYRFGKKDVNLEINRGSALVPGLIGISCTHLGGAGHVLWGIDVDKSSRGKGSREMMEVMANGGDIFICYQWLIRSTPYLRAQPLTEALTIRVSYVWNEVSGPEGRIGDALGALGKRILQVAGSNCYSQGELVIWKNQRV